MTKKVNVLIFPAGSEIAFEIYNSLKYNLHVEIFGASGKSDHAKLIYDEKHYFEDDFYIANSSFLEKFNTLLVQQKIDFIFPTHDTITLFLAQHQDNLQAKVLTSPYKSALIAREKKIIYDLFAQYDFCPAIYNYPFDNIKYPVFLKPNIGEGGKGTFLVKNKEELLMKTEKDEGLLACEFLPGEELSVDCFSDRHGKLRFVGPRTRDRINFGISFHSASVPLTDEIRFIAEKINETVKLVGAWFFQVKKDSNQKFKLMEFAVRQASTMGLYRQLGINFALLSIFDAMGNDINILRNNYAIELDRCLYNRYKLTLKYERVYFDFDDTLIVNDKVNTIALAYLYQCKNNGIKICLLTKHKYDLYESLEKYCLAKNLFDEIILIKPHDDKSKYIIPENSIFIDNYFYDREQIKHQLNIPVFDVDAIESLIL